MSRLSISKETLNVAYNIFHDLDVSILHYILRVFQKGFRISSSLVYSSSYGNLENHLVFPTFIILVPLAFYETFNIPKSFRVA